MDFGFTATELDLQRDIAKFAANELPTSIKGGITDYEEQFHGEFWEAARRIMPKVGERGWLAPSWPVKYGGKGSSSLTQIVCQEELAYWGIPGCDMGIGGISWIGPSLLAIGTEEQKQEQIPLLARGERFWCTAYSEPGSGSDMASMQSCAVVKGSDYVVSGQKVWTSAGPVADWCWLLVRTDPDVPKHKGLTLMMVDMRARGVTVRPIVAMSGIAPFAELFFDEVHVPRRNVVGQDNRGWNYIVAALDYERSGVAVTFSGLVRRTLDELVALVRQSSAGRSGISEGARIKLSDLAVSTETARLLAYRASLLLASGRPASAESAVSKLFSTELSQRAAQVAMEITGLHGQLPASSSRVVMRGRALGAYLSCTGNTILAGTSEIERNVIAQRGLGLPR